MLLGTVGYIILGCDNPSGADLLSLQQQHPSHFKYDCGPRLSVMHMMLWLKRAFHLKIESVMTHDFSMSLIFLIYVLGTRETVIFLPNNDFFGWFWGVP